MTEKEIIDLEKTVITILNRFLDNGELHKGIKVYVNKKLSNEFVDRMESIRPKENESIENWGLKIFGTKKFGIVFNSLETYDNTIGEIMASIVAPLIKRAGLPLGGLSFLFFMGNYGLTPFGIHKEAKGEEGFLFHLGPGQKEFYTWDTEELNSIEHNTTVFHEEIEEMLPSSQEHVLHAGSVMFIPHQVYHIANTEAFSLSIVMDYINPSRDKLEKELAKDICDQDTSQSDRKEYIAPIETNINNKSLGNLLEQESIMTKFNTALEKRILRLQSNAGILKQSLINDKNILPNGNFSFRGKRVFPIHLYEDEESISIIYARGREIIKKSNSYFKKIVASLNNGEILSFESVRKNLLPEWTLIDTYGLINELLVYEAIEIVNAETTINEA